MEQHAPDIVLADVGMPGRDGYQVAKHIKSTPRLAHIPVVLLTGAFEPIDQVRAAEAGYDGVLAKPFEPQLVIGRVRELLNRRSQVPPSIDSHLAPPLVDLPLVTAPPTPPSAASVDNYFDRLDQAFANLSTGPQASGSAPAAPADEAIDWFSQSPQRPDATSYPAPHATSQAGDRSGPAGGAQTAAAVATAPSAVPFPPLADAFAALLAAEQSAPPPAAAPVWPAHATPAPGEIVDEVTRRVLQQLSDKVIRETVADIVSNVAERLIREEIERIKKNIK
jgi:CheY-like chemotaxis protein